MDLTIEAVTGTIYDLCVSPFETILGIKTKIQRLEGIPVSQQHLIYGSTELLDEYCLEEYGIKSGCQLKLTIAMKVGPIHAHRIQIEDSAFLELAEYLQSQSPDECTYMLLSDDVESRSQLHSPIEISESRLSGSQTSLVATVQPKMSSVVENAVTRDKMKDLQSQLQSLRLNKTEPQAVRIVNAESNLKRNCTTKLIVVDNCSTATSKQFGYKCTTLHNKQSPSYSYNKDSKERNAKFLGREYQSYPRRISAAFSRKENSTKLLSNQSSKDIFSATVRKFNIRPAPVKSDGSHSNFLPAIVMKSNANNHRCLKCRRRTRISNTFTCRCGGTFCSIHRYAETHSCTFNYKAEGRESIARNNPLVTAPKLPKI